MLSQSVTKSLRILWFLLTALSLTTLLAAAPYRLSQLQSDPYSFGNAYSQLGITPGFFAVYFTIIEGSFALLFLLIGSFIFWKASKERMAIIVSLAFVTMSTITPMPEALLSADPALRYLVLFLRGSGIGLMLLFLYLFPNGRFIPRRMRWLWLIGAIYLASWLIAPSLAPPSALLVEAADLSTAIRYVPLGFLTISGIAAQAYRYRYVSNLVQRQQTKWVVAGIFGFLLTEAISLLLFSLLPAARNPGSFRLLFVLFFGPVLLIGATFIPVTMTLAVLRYHLWDINFIVRKTLAYGLLTAILALAYFASVTALQAVFASISGQETPVAIVISTLIIAGLFSPLRNRLQKIIDRRFFRRSYDAQQALTHFASTVRDEVDVKMLTAELVQVLQETMQPESISVWLEGE